MKPIWKFFASTELTIILAILVCLDAAVGSVLTVKYPEFYRSLDQAILLPALISTGKQWLVFTSWIYVLIALVALFTVNTAVCTFDRLYKIFTTGASLKSLAPHLVHIGFLVAVLGHLISSSYGFKSPYNPFIAGELKPVKESPGLALRLDDVEVTSDKLGNTSSLKTTVTIFEENREVMTGEIGVNAPLFYEGVGFYHLKEGTTTVGLKLGVDGLINEVALGGAFKSSGGENFKLGAFYPDLAFDELGKAFSRSNAFRNPHQEVVASNGKSGFLNIAVPGSAITLDGVKITLVDLLQRPYAILAINSDPGIWFVITGSSILVLGMLLVFIVRGGRAEIVKGRGEMMGSRT